MTIDLKRFLFAVVSWCGLTFSGCSSSPSSSATSPRAQGNGASTAMSSSPASAGPMAMPGAQPASAPASAATSEPPAGQDSPARQDNDATLAPAEQRGRPTSDTAAPHQGGGGSNTCTTSCTSDEDCACGRDLQTGACAFGNKSCIDSSKQCPDFCTGFNGKLRLRCEQQICTLR